ncbi:hypothetical protein BLAT2472_70370 [Burkholderia latens]
MHASSGHRCAGGHRANPHRARSPPPDSLLVVVVRQLACLGNDEVVVLREVQHEIECHRLDVAQPRIEDHAFQVAEHRRSHVQRIFQTRVRPARTRPEAGHHAGQTLRPVARAKLFPVFRDALDEEFGRRGFSHVVTQVTARRCPGDGAWVREHKAGMDSGRCASISRKQAVDARRRRAAPDLCSARLVSGSARNGLPAGLEKTFELYRSAASRVAPRPLFRRAPPPVAIAPRFCARLVKARKILYAALSYPHPTAAPSGLAAGPDPPYFVS